MEAGPGKQTVSLSVLEFLTWVSLRPRTYGEAMASWRSTCPRLSTWEDTLADGLIQIESGATMDQSSVTLTARGWALLENKT
ncbi:MAG: hypothetical protein LAO19_00620 [Acidobacteriia bacterium]|nr:hypothetical protein [Terriglobia bacterium]